MPNNCMHLLFNIIIADNHIHNQILFGCYEYDYVCCNNNNNNNK